ncbi:hypothetical protein SAY86_018821 [Trapa natans]|uniref:PWI domain-containing protein n=1 Tax=Trapa natans TaxID=22666 RepID=A0AAN7LAY8_TRANT|nr:hypothetical protein SAY86_018821 [Trapa natans]
MSGGFFRGTSADQDTRFSNKQAKLMKTLKFAPELEHLVDMTKVKMDVMKPWIATRVTELLGFEDEVLINFIYGLLDRKEVNGKEVQISLTGFMEKNTAKFMKELWNLLLSAQKNASGVPQQFLDAREEEARKKAETDRMDDEIRRKRDKENRELEREKLKTVDYQDQAKNANADVHLSSEKLASNVRSDDRQDTGKGNGVRGRDRRSRSRSISKSFSSSRSHSDERRHRSRSISQSPRARDHSIPSDMVHRSRKRSLTPRRRYPHESRSPPKWRSYYRRRSISRSVSPMRRSMRSPIKRRSRTPIRRRSVTPVRRRRSPSPVRRRRSPSPKRRRSPSPRRRPSSPRRRRSPSPRRQRSPSPRRQRSPSPSGQRSPSPRRQRSPSPRRQRSPSPRRQRSPPRRRSLPSPIEHESPSLVGHRSSSQMGPRSSSSMRNQSPLAVRCISPSPMRKSQHRSQSPARQRTPSSMEDRSPSPLRRQEHRSRSAPRQRSPPEAQGRSPVRGLRRSVTPQGFSNEASSPRIGRHSLSPVRRSPAIRRPSDQTSKGKTRLRESPVRQPRNHHEDRRSSSSDGSPIGQAKNQVMRGSRLDSSRRSGKHRHYDDSSDSSEQQEKNHISRERNSGKGGHSEIYDQISPPLDNPSLQGQKEKFVAKEGKNSEDKNRAPSDISRYEDIPINVLEPLGKANNQQGGASDTASEESFLEWRLLFYCTEFVSLSLLITLPLQKVDMITSAVSVHAILV